MIIRLNLRVLKLTLSTLYRPLILHVILFLFLFLFLWTILLRKYTILKIKFDITKVSSTASTLSYVCYRSMVNEHYDERSLSEFDFCQKVTLIHISVSSILQI